MSMKVLDEHILEYIWDETLDRIAQSTLVTYIGGSVGTYSDERAAEDAVSTRAPVKGATRWLSGNSGMFTRFQLALP